MYVFLLISAVSFGLAKVYDRCDLLRELKDHFPPDQLADWVCIAFGESTYNTSAIGRLNQDGSHDFGLFQLNDKFWCDHKKKGKSCRIRCQDLTDDDITDDISCAKRIFVEHKRLSGNGFNAWVAWRQKCQNGRSQSYIFGCNETNEITVSAPISDFTDETGLTSIANDIMENGISPKPLVTITPLSITPMASESTSQDTNSLKTRTTNPIASILMSRQSDPISPRPISNTPSFSTTPLQYSSTTKWHLTSLAVEDSTPQAELGLPLSNLLANSDIELDSVTKSTSELPKLKERFWYNWALKLPSLHTQ